MFERSEWNIFICDTVLIDSNHKPNRTEIWSWYFKTCNAWRTWNHGTYDVRGNLTVWYPSQPSVNKLPTIQKLTDVDNFLSVHEILLVLTFACWTCVDWRSHIRPKANNSSIIIQEKTPGLGLFMKPRLPTSTVTYFLFWINIYSLSVKASQSVLVRSLKVFLKSYYCKSCIKP